MNPSEPKPPPAELARLYDQGQPEAPPDGARERVLARVNASIAATPAPRAPVKLISGVAVTAAVGLVVWLSLPLTQVSPPEPYAPTAISPAASEIGDVPIADAPKAPAKAQAPRSRLADVDSLAEEQRLLEEARGAVAKRDVLHAQRALERYRARFPRGTLMEESDALAIEVLVCSGRYDDARRSLATFSSARTDSIFLPKLEKMIVERRCR